MKLNHIVNNNQSITLNLFSAIGGEGINGQQVANELDYAVNFLEVKEIVININSHGGSVIEGFSIVSAMRQAINKGIRVITNVEGIAASIAGIIAVAGQERNIVDYGRLMIHDPFFAGNKKYSEKMKNQLDHIKDSLVTILHNNSNVDKEVVSQLMGAETWLDAQEAVNSRLMDNLVSTHRQDLRLTNEAALIYNAVNTEFENKLLEMELENKVQELENSLSAKVEEMTGLENKVEELSTELEGSKNELEEAKNELETSKTALEAAIEVNNELKKQLAETVVNSAIEAGKIKEEKKDFFIELAAKDMDNFNTVLEGIETPKVSISNMIQDVEDSNPRKDWNYMDWQKNDPKGLEGLKNSNSAEFEKLRNEYYNN
jgi:ATP-dependent protease ClpP protease subunit